MPDWTITPAERFEQSDALYLLFRHFQPNEREGVVARSLTLLHTGELDGNGLLVARSEGSLGGAMLVTIAPGAVGLVWPPQAEAGPDQRLIEDALLAACQRWFRAQGVRVAQALVRPSEVDLGAPLERNGFPRITRLWYLRREVEAWTPACFEVASLTFQSCAEGSAELFATTLLRTYDDTQDCPELNGVRALPDIIAGHRAQGCYDPDRWWLVRDGSRPVGVLLVNVVADWEAWEIIYLGVVPEARGRGFGRELVQKALREAQLHQVREVVLCVDGRNAYAQQVYQQLGFETWDQREVYLCILPNDLPRHKVKQLNHPQLTG